MNPDGVVCGNYRTSLAGCDLNRRWINPNEILHPEIFASKQMILKFSTQRQIGLILDLHGHSGANNIFTYGNPIKDNPKESKMFPIILSKISDAFNYDQCKFKLNKNKYGTARINLFHELAIANIFTIEASFYGVRKEVKKFSKIY
jgi:murein tripeptide amidase MpaA